MPEGKKYTYLLKILLLVCIFHLSVVNHYILAQSTLIDSLKNLLKNHPQEDTIRVEVLTELAFRFYQTSVDSTLFFAKEAHQLAEKINYKKGKGRSLGRIALGYSTKGDYISALENYLKALELAEQTNDMQGIAAALNNIGYTYRVLARYEEALSYSYRSLEISKKLNWERGIIIGHGNIAWLLEKIKNNQKALQYAKQAVMLSQRTNDAYVKATSQHVLGKVYEAIQEYDSALKFYQVGLNYAQREALKQQIAFNSLGIGEIYTAQGKTKQAIDFLFQAMDFGSQSQSPDIVRDASLSLMKAYRDSNNPQRAFVYYDIYSHIRDSLFNIEKINEVRRLEFEYKTKAQQKEIDSLGAEREKQKEQIENQKVVFYNLIIIVLLLGLLALSIFRNRLKEKQKNIELMHQNLKIEKQKEALAVQTEALNESNASKDKIFSIVAHDLRSPLSSLKNTITLFEREMLTEEEFREILPKLKKTLNNTFELTDELLYWAKNQMNVIEFMPVRVKLQPIFEEQISSAEELAMVKKIKMSISLASDIADVKADKDMLKSILRNLISNAIKFCRNDDKITLSATEAHEFITISVEDTGVGITKENMTKLFTNHNFTTRGTAGERGTGLGLNLCKDFVEKNGGKIWVKSEEGKGSVFYFSLPRYV
jgi:two-component system, sensor histidine kinase and response regulator